MKKEIIQQSELETSIFHSLRFIKPLGIKIIKKIEDLKNTINQVDLIDNDGTLHQTAAECTCSWAHRISSVY